MRRWLPTLLLHAVGLRIGSALLLPMLQRHACPLPSQCAPRGSVLAQFDLEFGFDDEEEQEEEEAGAAAAVKQRGSASATPVEIPPPSEMKNMTVAALSGVLKQLGQKHTGSKPDLVERLSLIQRKVAMGLPYNDMEVISDEDMAWYMLQTANGFEGAVERTIMMARQAQRLHKSIDRVFVPLLEGETSVRDASVMPSYIFVRMKMNQELHFLISNLNYVVSFVGADRGARSMSGQMQATSPSSSPPSLPPASLSRSSSRPNTHRGSCHGGGQACVPPAKSRRAHGSALRYGAGVARLRAPCNRL